MFLRSLVAACILTIGSSASAQMVEVRAPREVHVNEAARRMIDAAPRVLPRGAALGEDGQVIAARIPRGLLDGRGVGVDLRHQAATGSEVKASVKPLLFRARRGPWLQVSKDHVTVSDPEVLRNILKRDYTLLAPTPGEPPWRAQLRAPSAETLARLRPLLAAASVETLFVVEEKQQPPATGREAPRFVDVNHEGQPVQETIIVDSPEQYEAEKHESPDALLLTKRSEHASEAIFDLHAAVSSVAVIDALPRSKIEFDKAHGPGKFAARTCQYQRATVSSPDQYRGPSRAPGR